MWINLIGLQSGVIALCGPWEHSQHSSMSLDLLVITGTLLTQDALKNTSTTPEKSAQACTSPDAHGPGRSHRWDFTPKAKCVHP